MVPPRNGTEELLLSITKKRKTFIHQIHTKRQETVEIKLTKSRERISFKLSNYLGPDSD